MPERTVVFYECLNVARQPPFDRRKAVSVINGLADSDWRIPDGDSDLAVIVDQEGTAANATHLRLLRIRPDRPFKLSAARQLSPVDVANDESITEFTWAVLWPDNFLAAISSRDAPAHKRLGYYFFQTSAEATHMVNLFRPDLVQRLKEMRETGGLRNVQVKVQVSKLAQIEADRQIRGFRQLFNAGRGTEATTIGIELSVGRSGRDAVLGDDLAAGTEQLAGHVDLVESLHVKGRDARGNLQTINLKHERIALLTEIEFGDSDSTIYRRIERARTAAERDITRLGEAVRGN